MMIPAAFVFDDEFKFKTNLRFEFWPRPFLSPPAWQEPLSHFIDICQCLPNARDRRVQCSLNYNCFSQVTFCAHSHFAFVFGSIIPKTLPARSSAYASQPIRGIAIFGTQILPPRCSIFWIVCSSDFTATVFRVPGLWPSRGRVMPPLMPGSLSSPVVTSQYSIGPPSNFWNFHPKTSR